MASYPNRNPLRDFGAIRVCVTIALISVTRVEAVVDNEMTGMHIVYVGSFIMSRIEFMRLRRLVKICL